MILILIVVASIFGAACADCDACVDGVCNSRNTLVQGFHISDQMAVDRNNSILYLQLNSNLTTAFYLGDLRIRLVQAQNTSGLTVNQEKSILYTADENNNLYEYKYNTNKTEVATMRFHKEADLLKHYDHTLYYTIKGEGLYCFKDEESNTITKLKNYTITDFVVDKEKNIYFVSQNRVYTFRSDWLHDPEILTDKGYVLAIDKYDDVYLGDASVNIVFQLDKATKELHEYAAYQTGAVEQLVFDGANNIVFHDAADGSVNSWKPVLGTSCTLEAPHVKYAIKKGPPKIDSRCNEI